MGVPTLDNTVTGTPLCQGVVNGSSTVTTNSNFNSAQSPDTLILMVAWADPTNNASLTSLTNTGGLSLTLRSSVFDATNNINAQVYSAPLASPTSGIQFTATLSVSVDKIGIVGAAFNGIFNDAIPWDSDSGLAAGNWQSMNAGSGPQTSQSFDTQQADDFAFLFYVSANTNGPAAPNGGTGIPGGGVFAAVSEVNNTAGTFYWEIGFWGQPLSSTQSGAQFAFTTAGNGTFTNFAVDAITGDNNVPGSPAAGSSAGAATVLGVGVSLHRAVGISAGAAHLAGVGATASIVASGSMGGPIVIRPMTATATGVVVPPPPPLPPPPPPFPFPMAQTLLLDLSAWDLTVDIDGNIAIASLPYSAVQDAASSIRLFLGELWYDTTQGVPYTQILGQPANLSFLKRQFSDAALTVPAVVEAVTYITGLTNRGLSGQVQLTLVDGSNAVVGFIAKEGTIPAAFIVGHSILGGGDVV